MTGAWELNWQRQINKRKGTQILCNVNTNLNFYMHGGLHRKAIRTPNKQLDLGACIHFNKGRSIWKNDKTKRKRGLGFCCFVVVQLLSHIWLFATPWIIARQAVYPSLSPWVCSNSCPLSQWCHTTISCSVAPSFPALNLSQHQGLFQWVSSSHQVAKVLELQLQHQSFQWIFRVDFL